MIAAVVGCGNWGARVARRLAQVDGVLVSAVFDEDRTRARALAGELPTWPNGETTTEATDFVQYLDVMTPDAVVLAVPAGHRLPYVEAICRQYRERKQRIRIEKPLGVDMAEAEQIARLCAAAGVQLTVGFTLLHHPLYEAAFAYLSSIGEQVERVTGIRAGRAPAHDVHPMLDMGVHAASIAAHLGVGRRHTDLVALQVDTSGARTTRMIGHKGSIVTVDEIALTVETPHGRIHVGDSHDALGRDLEAWVNGTHRGSVEVALAAQVIVDAHIATPEIAEVAA
jgi:predicted dehydrogenase